MIISKEVFYIGIVLFSIVVYIWIVHSVQQRKKGMARRLSEVYALLMVVIYLSLLDHPFNVLIYALLVYVMSIIIAWLSTALYMIIKGSFYENK